MRRRAPRLPVLPSALRERSARAFRDWGAAWLVTRALLALTATAALLARPAGVGEGVWTDPFALPLLDAWSRWDGRWYVAIAAEGYAIAAEGTSSVTFSPLLPALMRATLALTPLAGVDGLVVAGILLSNAAALVGCALVFRIALRETGDRASARRAVLYLLVSPASLYLSSVYPNALYLALAAGAFAAAFGGRWWLAGVLAALGALTRQYGVVLVVPLAVEYLAQRRFDPRAVGPSILWLGLPVAVFLGWAGYVAWLSGDPLMLLRVGSTAWARPTPLWEVLARYAHEPIVLWGPTNGLFDLLAAVGLVVVAVAAWRTLRPSLAVWVALSLPVFASWGTLSGVMRYGLELFPVFLVLGRAGRDRRFHRGFLVLSGALLLINQGAIAWGHFVA